MNRRDLFRQTFLGAAAAALPSGIAEAREFPSDYDASKELARADWKPLFLDDHQNQTLVVFSDILIPATDTPGAKAALVNRFLDAGTGRRDTRNAAAFSGQRRFPGWGILRALPRGVRVSHA
jgi:hypothetical protein